jgi:hypothetical protein
MGSWIWRLPGDENARDGAGSRVKTGRRGPIESRNKTAKGNGRKECGRGRAAAGRTMNTEFVGRRASPSSADRTEARRSFRPSIAPAADHARVCWDAGAGFRRILRTADTLRFGPAQPAAATRVSTIRFFPCGSTTAPPPRFLQTDTSPSQSAPRHRPREASVLDAARDVSVRGGEGRWSDRRIVRRRRTGSLVLDDSSRFWLLMILLGILLALGVCLQASPPL